MNINEQFVDKILQETASGHIKWNRIRGLDEYIPNVQYVVRGFSAQVPGFDIVSVVELNMPRYNEDFGQYFPMLYYQVYIIKEGMLAKTIDEDTVDREKLSWLLSLVAERVTSVDNSIADYIGQR